MAPQRRLTKPVIFICDLQEKFRPAISNYASVITTTQKLLKAAQTLSIPVLATTQLKAKLGETCEELGLDGESGVRTLAHVDKSAFSMMVPEVQSAFDALYGGTSVEKECVVVGIESHICVTQTSLDLLAQGHRVFVLADGVSSCNREEVPIALARLRAEGAVVTTSESWLYECMGDAGIGEFKGVAGVVKEFGAKTKEVLQTLCRM